MLPTTYILAKQYGIIGPAIATLISTSIYNTVRLLFLYIKFRLQPFRVASLYTVLAAAACYAICYFAFHSLHGFRGLFIRSIAFILLYGGAAVYFSLSPDIQPLWRTVKKRLGIR